MIKSLNPVLKYLIDGKVQIIATARLLADKSLNQARDEADRTIVFTLKE